MFNDWAKLLVNNNPYKRNFPTYSESNDIDSENKEIIYGNNRKKEISHNTEKNEENSLKKESEKIFKKIFKQENKSQNLENNNKYNFDSKLLNLEKDKDVDSFNNLFEDKNKNFLFDDDDDNENKDKNCNYTPKINMENGNNIFIKEDEKKKNNIHSSTLFTSSFIPNQNKSIEENNNISKTIQYKKESAQKMIKAQVLKFNLTKLIKLIKKYLPKGFTKRENIIHAANCKLITSQVRNKDNKKFMNMTFRKILIYGKNRITKKDCQYKNYKHIKMIIRYLKEYYKKHECLSHGLIKIKVLLNKKPPGLIKNFVKSKTFEKFKKRKESIIFQEGILKEKGNIDIFTEKGIVSLFKPLELEKKYKKRKVISGIYRKCLHFHHH